MPRYTLISKSSSELPRSTAFEQNIGFLGEYDHESPHLLRRPAVNTMKQISIALSFGALLAAAILGLLRTTTVLPTSSVSLLQRKKDIAKWSSCGDSVPEAKDLGCVYDPSLLVWMKPYCKPDDIADQFIRQPIHTVYHDEDMQKPMNMSYYLSGEFPQAYDAVEHHKAHCLNAWRALTQASLLKTPDILVPFAALSWEHTVHCSEDVIVPNMDSPWRTKPHVHFWVQFENCELLR
ncbi:hypothetical protein SNOG_01539 [Parastagonospora nodorum SN15]|uniref:Uncharacterized protein n=1 Tax=Phaeosphaeria nodorum (strain SN15 / ATCC MYA-4574 / FGSC 10173) TaxID=321614 RepID=Q0V375_PHANO|nr:hypothetical protein SNOG_01539 [Parastagonospora nodorum SN15]EAT91188.1 hypothetical protein SNOG_01539 [Parastagonospora nodorum SN15]